MPADADRKSQPDLSVWVLTDGKIGDDVQCLAVAGALNPAFEKKVIAPRKPWEWFAPWGPVDPRDAPDRTGSLLAPPFPDVLIASGRRAVPYARAVKEASGGKTFTVFLKDPRIDPGAFDLVWAPTHDRLSGENVFSTLTSPHGLAARIAAARVRPETAVGVLPKPLLGVLIGGPSGGARFDDAVAADLAQMLAIARKDYASLAIAPSRRTPAAFMQALRKRLQGDGLFIWNGEGANPYTDILALADCLIVTADSHNMMSEAVSVDAGVYSYRPPGLAEKLDWTSRQLDVLKVMRPLVGAARPFTHKPIDATAEIVEKVRQRIG